MLGGGDPNFVHLDANLLASQHLANRSKKRPGLARHSRLHMPLNFTQHDGIVGDDLRRARGAHNVLATGPCTVLANFIPAWNAATNEDGAYIFQLRQILWAVLALLRPGDDIPPDLLLVQYIVHVSRAGRAFERILLPPGNLNVAACCPSVARQRMVEAALRVEPPPCVRVLA